MICHAPWQACFLKDQIRFGFFCSGSPNYHFCHIIFNSDQWFQEKMFIKFLTLVHNGNWRHLLAAMISSSNLLCQIDFNSDNWFMRYFKFLI